MSLDIQSQLNPNKKILYLSTVYPQSFFLFFF